MTLTKIAGPQRGGANPRFTDDPAIELLYDACTIISTDGSRMHDGSAGCGIYDPGGVTRKEYSFNLGCASILRAELEALRFGLTLRPDNVPATLATDCLIALQLITKQELTLP
jgi:hypothetical protein